MRLKKNDTVIIATHNKGKKKEFQSLFSNYNIKTLSSEELQIPEPIEYGKSFEENALIKAKSCMPSKNIIISDDSGLCVNSLKGDPGIYSARWAKMHGGWYEAMEKIKQEIDKNKAENFSAYYHCTLCVAWINGDFSLFNGRIDGYITWPPRGKKGFGYDPIFVPNHREKTFGEMDVEEKMSLDHRYIAFKKLMTSHF
tara:strand:- start:306 stop:899 length:594 start_codon:yes stop_codon:yes gene_type:complete